MRPMVSSGVTNPNFSGSFNERSSNPVGGVRSGGGKPSFLESNPIASDDMMMRKKISDLERENQSLKMGSTTSSASA